MARIKLCREKGCSDAATTGGYCRLHYLRRWKQIKDSQRASAAKKLNRYIERICKQNPDDYLEVIKRDLKKPDFEESVVHSLDFSEGAASSTSEEEDEAEIERIIKKLKVEEGF